MNELILIRHGETEWSAAGKHTSVTDLPLTPAGEEKARALALRLSGRHFAAVLSSPRLRAARTAHLAGLADVAVEQQLAEWEYGDDEGRTTAEIRAERPGWDKWRDGFAGGESIEELGARVDKVLERVRPLLADGDVALVGHGHCLRVLGARWLGLPPSFGGSLLLGTASISLLGTENERPVTRGWNLRA